MRLKIRRVGNSLGVIIPKATLEEWDLGEGDSLELVRGFIRPPRTRSPGHRALDELKRRLASAVVAQIPAREIRARSLANLYRWKKSGAWFSAYDEWQKILEGGDDGELYAAMLGRDERSNRLRQSPPYIGLLERSEVERLNEEASA